jgi:hypothetical protein
MEEEKILCAAIWYKELEPKRDNSNQLPINIKTGVVICGYRHHSCVAILSVTTGLRSVTWGDIAVGENVQGFLTSKNRFVDRKEAFVIADCAHQILNDSPVFNCIQAELHSEDLY